jgi:hypothetical protein
MMLYMMAKDFPQSTIATYASAYSTEPGNSQQKKKEHSNVDQEGSPSRIGTHVT